MILENFQNLSNQYDVFFFDIWGVLHNGYTPFPDVVRTLTSLKKENKKIFLLSNAPRLAESAIHRLEEIGINSHLYDEIYTSGIDCYQSLNDTQSSTHSMLGKKFFHIGGDPGKNFETLSRHNMTKELSDADFLLISSIEDTAHTIEVYKDVLYKACMNKLPLVCANSDYVALFGNSLVLCAGALAAFYEELGGHVLWHGKPSLLFFERAYQAFQKKIEQNFDKKKILMIGDSLRTDIKGATNFGIDSAFVLSGIHREDIHQNDIHLALKDLYEQHDVAPTHVMHEVIWDKGVTLP